MRTYKFYMITDRLQMREIMVQDTEQIVLWRSNPAVYPFFRSPHAITKEEHITWFYGTYLKDEKQIRFLVIEQKSQTAIGVVGIRKVEIDVAEVSYLLDEKAQGKGYASEAVQGLLKFAKEQWSCLKVIAEIHSRNLASIKMIQRLQFQQVSVQGEFLIFERKI